jgi:hypothetical protein
MNKKARYYIWAFNCVQDVHAVTNHMYGIFIVAVVYKPYVIRQYMIDKGVVRHGWSLDSCIHFWGEEGVLQGLFSRCIF